MSPGKIPTKSDAPIERRKKKPKFPALNPMNSVRTKTRRAVLRVTSALMRMISDE